MTRDIEAEQLLFPLQALIHCCGRRVGQFDVARFGAKVKKERVLRVFFSRVAMIGK